MWDFKNEIPTAAKSRRYNGKADDKMKKILQRTVVWLLILSLSFSVFHLSGQNAKTVNPTNDTEAVSVVSDASGEDIRIGSRFLELLFGKEKDSGKSTEEEGKEKDSTDLYLIPGGMVFGAKIKLEHVMIQDPGEYPSLRAGDKIICLNGKEIHSVTEFKNEIALMGEAASVLDISRGGKRLTVTVSPKLHDGEYRLGITLKDTAAGIGTITYIDPSTGMFGGLGHGICDAQTGEVYEISGGDVTSAILGGIKKGESGKPGELSGILTDRKIGKIYSNTECGIFGQLDNVPQKSDTAAIKVGSKSDVRKGEASIISTVKMGMSKEYKIEITDINYDSCGSKSFKIKVTDPTLIAVTGGILKGMSGSVIIQDGKIIGAVTHVMINEPTEGYGIFIENMLGASKAAEYQGRSAA